MDINASPLNSTQANSANQQRLNDQQHLRDQLQQEQRQKAQAQDEVTLNSKHDIGQRNTQTVYQANKSANIGQTFQTPPTPEQPQREDDAIELKPLVVTERRHPGVSAFLQVAGQENDFHIIDTFA